MFPFPREYRYVLLTVAERDGFEQPVAKYLAAWQRNARIIARTCEGFKRDELEAMAREIGMAGPTMILPYTLYAGAAKRPSVMTS